MMKGIYLLLGSNQGDRMGVLKLAAEHIHSMTGKVMRHSSVYCTAPWGYSDQPDFYNQVLEVESDLSPVDLLNSVEQIMKMLGRVRKFRWGERIIDIDILYYGDLILEKPDLIIPHPRIQDRRFALVPLCELASELVHPVLKCDQQTLLDNCVDELKVQKLKSSGK